MDDTDRFAQCRKKNKKTQKDIAEEAGVCVRTVSNLETGKTRYCRHDTAVRLARSYGMTLEEFYGKAGIREEGNGSFVLKFDSNFLRGMGKKFLKLKTCDAKAILAILEYPDYSSEMIGNALREAAEKAKS